MSDELYISLHKGDPGGRWWVRALKWVEWRLGQPLRLPEFHTTCETWVELEPAGSGYARVRSIEYDENGFASEQRLGREWRSEPQWWSK